MLPNDSYSSSYLPPDSASALEQDPAYLAYINAAGLQNQQAIAQYNQTQAGLQSALNSSLAQQQLNNPIAMQQNAGGYEARGISRSGEALKGQANLAAQQQQAMNDTIARTAQQITAAQQEQANRIAQNSKEAAQAGLDAAERLARQRAAVGGANY